MVQGNTSEVEVVVRLRPFLPKESEFASNPSIHCVQNSVVVDPAAAKKHRTSRYYGKNGVVRSSRRYDVDCVHGPRSTQQDVYHSSVSHVVKDLFEGKNASVFAYGGTGSGKTFTMFGDGSQENPGVIFQVVNEMLERKAALEGIGKSVTIRAHHFEVYNEGVYDLFHGDLGYSANNALAGYPQGQGAAHLHNHNPGMSFYFHGANSNPSNLPPLSQNICRGPNGPGKLKACELKVQETADGAADLPHITWHAVDDLTEFEMLMRKGARNRVVAETNANERSSRSHAVLTLEVTVRQDNTTECGTTARLKLSDLAGSERAAANSNDKVTFKEGANINKSLLALGSVVKALATKSQFIPYRGSKLTRLLKDCLGGNCNTVMIVCISPHPDKIDETNNTMQYAMYAKKIEACVRVNDVKDSAEARIASLQATIAEQNVQIESLKEELKAAGLGIPLNHQSPRVRHSGRVGVGYPAGIMNTPRVCTDAATQSDMDEKTSSIDAAAEALGQTVKRFVDEQRALLQQMAKVDEEYDAASFELRDLNRRLAIQLFQEQLKDPNHGRNGVPSLSLPVSSLQKAIVEKSKNIRRLSTAHDQLQNAMTAKAAERKRLLREITCRDLRSFNALLREMADTQLQDAENETIKSTSLAAQIARDSQRLTELTEALERLRGVALTVTHIGHGTTVQELAQLKMDAAFALAFLQLPDCSDDVASFSAVLSKALHVQPQSSGQGAGRTYPSADSGTVRQTQSQYNPNASTEGTASRVRPTSLVANTSSTGTSGTVKVDLRKQLQEKDRNDAKKHKDPYAYVRSLSSSNVLAVPSTSSQGQANPSQHRDQHDRTKSSPVPFNHPPPGLGAAHAANSSIVHGKPTSPVPFSSSLTRKTSWKVGSEQPLMGPTAPSSSFQRSATVSSSLVGKGPDE